jgi:hypothetical protein
MTDEMLSICCTTKRPEFCCYIDEIKTKKRLKRFPDPYKKESFSNQKSNFCLWKNLHKAKRNRSIVTLTTKINLGE